ncbi:ATP-dependent endonuclease [Aureimonas sp. AU4]|uniref:ATP-dependent nuclease n=1 Tax=Aureimonas sp. AU4 TaxID=1638163 RepID=UPI0009ECBEC3|nr:AAA family ATPase [Aureimonas sp. AU4]
MNYIGFRIQNFKGIKDAYIGLSESNHARVHTLVGLNESGKTTILEAIHSFAPDSDTKIIVGSDLSGSGAVQDLVPRYAVADFTGDISVSATIRITSEDKIAICKTARDTTGNSISFDKEGEEVFSYTKFHKYQNGDHKGNFRRASIGTKLRKTGQRKFFEVSGNDLKFAYDAIESLMPRIAYFLTFVFDFPDKIYLSGRDDGKSLFYRKVFQDILDYDHRGHKITDHIVSRIHKSDFQIEWPSFHRKFNASGEGEKIDQVIDRAAQTVTTNIFKQWNDIFGEDASGKEVIIPWDIDEGPARIDKKGVEAPAILHDAYVQFRIKEGGNRYNVESRSLGFRWFFAFLLFTQFRVARQHGAATIFLFDEPASNLHSAAQQKLIESFPEIAKDPHILIYSTHSHYMIEPKWLEQAYIVKNSSNEPGDSVIDLSVLDDQSIDVQAIPYRKFVHENPSKISYFQPILDKIQIFPSKFDVKQSGIILEGKSDYYVLRYAAERIIKKTVVAFPAVGAGTLGALIALNRGWGLPVKILLDGDDAGKREKKRYQKEFYLSDDEILTLSEINPSWKVIEDLLDEKDIMELGLQNEKDGKINKQKVLSIFQERLVSGADIPLSKETKENLRALAEFVRKLSM